MWGESETREHEQNAQDPDGDPSSDLDKPTRGGMDDHGAMGTDKISL